MARLKSQGADIRDGNLTLILIGGGGSFGPYDASARCLGGDPRWDPEGGHAAGL